MLTTGFLSGPRGLCCLWLLLLAACSKTASTPAEPLPPGVATAAETKPAFNNSSYGVYKGVVIGSVGSIVVRINNGEPLVKAYLQMGSERDTLGTTQAVAAGQPIVNLPFTGRSSSFSFSAEADGSNASINNLLIAGHPNARAIVVHENSTQQVLCYGGSFTGDLNGNIAFIKVGTAVRSAPVSFLARADIDNFFLQGNCLPEQDSARNHTHYMYDQGNPYRTFSGYPTFSLARVSGPWVSYYPPTSATLRGSINCVRTY